MTSIYMSITKKNIYKCLCLIAGNKFPHWILKFTFKIEFSNPALGGSNINMNWPIPSKGRGGSTQQFAPKQNPKFLLRILQFFF